MRLPLAPPAPPVAPPPAHAAAPDLPRPLPTPDDLAALDVNGFLRRLDASLDAIAHDGDLAAILPPGAAGTIADSRSTLAHTDGLFRSTLRGALVATSFRDLPVAARVHPAVQDRMWSAMDEIDTSVQTIADSLAALTGTERAAITRALRDRPDLGDAILTALESGAERAGVSEERRGALRRMGEHACFRLRQSADACIEEYTAKIRKVRARPLPEAERYLAAQLGEPAFTREKDWHLAVEREWQKLLADQTLRLSPPADDPPGGIDADDAYAPPAGGGQSPPSARLTNVDPNRGKTVLKVGAWLFGLGVFSGCTGGILISAQSEDAAIAGLISFTAAAVLSFVGIICLLVGAILRLVTRAQLRSAGDDTDLPT